MRRRGWVAGAALAAVVALTVGVAGVASAGSGETPKASGAPINFGFVNLENSPVGSFPSLTAGVQAGVEYVNNELGGIHGRPIQPRTCTVSGSAASSIGCATQLLSQNPLAVFNGIDFFWFASLSAYSQAGMPVLGGIPTSQPQYQATNSAFFYGGGIAGYTGLAKYAGQVLHAKTVALLYDSTVPGNSLYLTNYVGPVLKKYGVHDVYVTPAPAASSDMTTPLAAANQRNPDAMIAFSVPTQCLSAIRAHQSLAIHAKLMLAADCSDPKTLATVGSAANGVIFGYQQLASNSPSVSANPEVQTYLKAMKKYAPNALLDETATNGFTEIWDAWEVLNSAPPSALGSPQALFAAFKAAKNTHNFMGHPFTCDGLQVPGAPAVCDAHSRIYVVKDGKLVDALNTWENGSNDVLAP
jgi:branched-chain amino acid transport system substrate-binding protein